MPSKGRSSRRARNVDAESGKNRVTRRDKKPAPLESESESYAESDSDLESDLDMPAKDDSRRKSTAPPPPSRKGKTPDGRSKALKGVEDRHEELADDKKSDAGTRVAPHMQILLAATYHIGLSSISRPSVSSYIPSGHNFFTMVYWISYLLVENSVMHEMCPEFFTPAIYLYYGHVYFYHILRARNAAGSDVLTRLERRALTFYERVGPAESWPIAAPLLGMLSYFGSHKTEDPMYGWIVPSFPDFSTLKSGGTPNSLGSLHSLIGGSRIPLIPALQKLVYNYANDIADFDSGFLRPVGQDNIDNTHTFCGLTTSTATNNNFQALAFNLCWREAQETGTNFGMWDYDTKRARLNRWSVPNVLDTADNSTLTGFLGFTDNASFDWMKHLLSIAAKVNRFFPGSGNLSQVSPLTTIGAVTQVTYYATNSVATADNVWYHARNGLTISSYGYTNTEAGLIDSKMAMTVSPNALYHTSGNRAVIPAACARVESEQSGPFFVDSTARPTIERKAVFITENTSQIDPGQRFLELVSTMYDNRAGRA